MDRGKLWQDRFRDFSKTNVIHLTCKMFAPDKRKANQENICGCGRHLDWHTDQNLFSELKGQKWDPDLHTTSIAPNCFGEMEFCSFGVQNNFAKYVRVQHNISPDKLWALLQNVWKLSMPKLVISVTGGARKLQLKPRLHHAFTQGLIDVASTTDAWIISGGLATGVMQWVGQAVYEHKLADRSTSTSGNMVALGIAPWGCVANSESLAGTEYLGAFPTQYSLHDCKDAEKSPLDHNHTHFILVDNGTDSIWGGEIALRAKLEAQIASTAQAGSNIKIPVVMIVCEGGENTLETVWDATARHDVPAVIMKGSGRAADLLSTAYKVTSPRKKDDSLTHFGDNFDDTFSKLIAMTFGWKDDKIEKIAKSLKQIKDLLSKRHLINVFELDDSTCRDLDKAVLTALLKASRSNAESQINLALTWDRSDIAKQYIFTMENRMFWQQFSLNDCMLDALIKERSDFVQLFLENGVNLLKFLTQDRLKNLYLTSLGDESSRISPIIKNLIKSNSIYSTESCFRCNQIDESDQDDLILKNIEKVLRCLFDDKFAYVDLNRTSDDTVLTMADKPLETLMNLNQTVVQMDPYMDLFTWCLLFNKQSLAYYFWKSCKDPIGGALFACNLLKSLSDRTRAQEELDLSTDLEQQARLYENMASDILNICYSREKVSAQNLLTRKLDKSWLGTTLFSLAENASLMKFMQLSCCQTKLNRIWTGSMTENTPDWKVILAFVPGLITMLRFDITEENSKLEELPDESENEHDYCQETDFNDDKLKSWTDVGHMKNGGGDIKNGTKSKGKRKKVKRKFLYTTLAFCSGSGDTDGKGTIGITRAYYRYFTAPVTKFYCHTLSYLVFLAIFTFVTLARLRPLDEDTLETYMELILWVWVLSLWIEEIRQILARDAKSINYKIVDHFSSFWNQLDFFMFAFFLAGVVLRCAGDVYERLLHSKVAYALALLIAYLRLLETFYVSKVLGPKIVAIQKMLRDLLVFICLFAVFILSFGVAMQAILYSRAPFDHRILLQSVYSPYWQTFGGAQVERAEGKNDATCSDNDTELSLNENLHLCPRHGYLVPALLAIYILLTNVLLLNLLIAMFSSTFQKVEENAEQLWRFNRYPLIKAYYDAPTLPAPFIIIGHVAQLIVYFCSKKMKRKFKIRDDFVVALNEQENIRLSAFEKAGQESYIASNDKQSMNSIDSRLAFTKDKLDQALDQLDEIRDRIQIDTKPLASSSHHDLNASKIDINPDVHVRLNQIEGQLEKQNKTLQMLLCALDKKLNLLE